MKNTIIIVALLCASVTVLFVVSNWPMKSIDWHLTGRVIDQGTLKPISNANISIISDDRGFNWQKINTNYQEISNDEGLFDVRCHGQYVHLFIIKSNYEGESYLFMSRDIKTGNTNIMFNLSQRP